RATLAPLATGVLILAAGTPTKLLTHVPGPDKSYTATIRLGRSTVTDDAEGEVTATADTSDVTEVAVRETLDAMVGEIDQVPSAVSAVKIDGKRAYKRVREGETVELAARRVTIAAIEVERIARGRFLDVDIDVSCSSGTYIRAIARDLGEALGV